jgi:hypothetical protein
MGRRGVCRNGVNCTFAHGHHNLKPRFGNHSEQERRPRFGNHSEQERDSVEWGVSFI